MLPKRRKPTQPGAILNEEFLKPLGLTPRTFAERLGKNWSEPQVERLIQGKEKITLKIAQELADALETNPKFWMRLQDICDRFEKVHKENEKGSLKAWKKAL